MGLFGLTATEFVRRAIFAFLWAAVTFALAFYLPIFVLRYSGLPIEETPPIIFPGAILLTSLGVLREIFRNHPIGIAAMAGLGIASTIYLLKITNNGFMSIEAQGYKIVLEFPILVYLFATSSLLVVVSVVWSAIHSVGSEPMEKMEEEITL